MKKKLLILAAIAVSGLAAVVASNTKDATATCQQGTKEYTNGRCICCHEGYHPCGAPGTPVCCWGKAGACD